MQVDMPELVQLDILEYKMEHAKTLKQYRDARDKIEMIFIKLKQELED